MKPNKNRNIFVLLQKPGFFRVKNPKQEALNQKPRLYLGSQDALLFSMNGIHRRANRGLLINANVQLFFSIFTHFTKCGQRLYLFIRLKINIYCVHDERGLSCAIVANCYQIINSKSVQIRQNTARTPEYINTLLFVCLFVCNR